jgi:hypothetical protein
MYLVSQPLTLVERYIGILHVKQGIIQYPKLSWQDPCDPVTFLTISSDLLLHKITESHGFSHVGYCITKIVYAIQK